MPAPVIRVFRVTFSDSDAVGTVKDAEDLNSGKEDFLLLMDNRILDVVNEKDPSKIEVEVQLWKNGSDTGLRFYSTTMSPSSAGRVAVGPIDLGPGNYQVKVKLLTNNLGTDESETYGVVIKFARRIQ